MTITLVGGPFNDEQHEIGAPKDIADFRIYQYGQELARYIKVPGQGKYFIFEPYYKAPEL